MRVPPRILTTVERTARLREIALAVAAIVFAAFANPNRPLPIDICLWHRFTGFECPTCGLTRAFCHAVQGNFAQSLAMHPAGILLFAALAGWIGWSLTELFVRQRARGTIRTTIATVMR